MDTESFLHDSDGMRMALGQQTGKDNPQIIHLGEMLKLLGREPYLEILT